MLMLYALFDKTCQWILIHAYDLKIMTSVNLADLDVKRKVGTSSIEPFFLSKYFNSFVCLVRAAETEYGAGKL
jgi:hypothetical protein